jgi:hypothetical protein
MFSGLSCEITELGIPGSTSVRIHPQAESAWLSVRLQERQVPRQSNSLRLSRRCIELDKCVH